MKKQKFILIILLILFLTITTLVLTNRIKSFDDIIYNSLINLRCESLDIYFKTITKFGNTIPIFSIVIILMLFLNRKEQFMLGTCAITSVTINSIIKNIIKRPRPSHLRLIRQGGYSFPSGHSMIAVAVYGLLIYLILTKMTNKKLKIFTTILLILLILSIGLSRIYVGVHYPSDVVAGYSLATIIVIIIINSYNKYFRGN